MQEANAEAEYGYASRAAGEIDSALALSREPSFLGDLADAVAAAGQDQKSETLMAEGRRARPEDTLMQNVIAPRIDARLQIRHGKAAAAIQTLAAAQPYEDGRWFHTHVLRGEAYLGSGAADNAVQEFRKFLSRRALRPFSFYYPLAQLALARALAAQHDTTNARTAYQDFFALWKDADPDIPILKEAKAEYARLQ